MQRIATETRQRDKFGPGKDGFTAGNIATGLSSTQLEPVWFDNLQEEVSNVVEIELGPLDSFDRFQLWKAIDAQIDRKVAGIPAQPAFVLRAGDTMTGPLGFNAGLGPPAPGGSIGSRLVLFPGAGGPESADLAIGIMPGGMWFSARTVADFFAWYGGTTQMATLGGGTLTLTGTTVLGRDPLAPLEAATKRYVDDRIDLSGYLPLSGGTITGDLAVNGHTYLNSVGVVGNVDSGGAVNAISLYGANAINGNGTLGILGNVNFYSNLDVVGHTQVGTLGTNGAADIGGHAQFYSSLGVNGNTNIAGQMDFTGGGFIYAYNRCYQGYEVHLSPGGIFSAAHGRSPQGGLWDTGGPLHTRAEAIEAYERGLAEVRRLQPMIYDERRFIGVALEDCRQAIPEMVALFEVESACATISASERTSPPEMSEGLSLNALFYALINAVRELAERMEALEDDRAGPPTPRV